MRMDLDDRLNIKHNMMGMAALALILLLAVLVAYSNFDETDAREALGTTYDFNEGWKEGDADDDAEELRDVKLPYVKAPGKDSKAVTLFNKLSADYEGLSLSLSTENCAIRVFVDGKPVYESGFVSNKGNRWRRRGIAGGRPSGQKEAPGKSGSNPPQYPDTGSGETSGSQSQEAGSGPGNKAGMPDEAAMDNEVADSISSGDYMIDLGNQLADDSAIRIRLVRVDDKKPIRVESAKIGKRDAAVIGVVRSSMFSLVCVIILIMCAAVLVTIDLVRFLSHHRTRGLYRLSFLALDVTILVLDETELMRKFFANEYFFGVMDGICSLMMPLLILWFIFRGFRQHYLKLLTVLGAVSAVYAIVALGLELSQTHYLVDMWRYTMALQIAVLVSVIVMLLDWHRRAVAAYHVVWMDVTGYGLLLVTVVLSSLKFVFGQSFSRQGNIQSFLVTLAFIFLVLQHVHIFFARFREDALSQARILETQMREVEHKNRQLTAAREEAEEARQEAIAANEAKSHFLANMSHEIRTPINAVLGMDEMIMRETSEREIKGYAMDIYSSGQTLLSLINDILDFSKIESGKMEIVPVDYDISSLLHDLYNMTAARAKSKDLVFTVEAAQEIPSRYYGDDVRIRQVLINILTNAVKYTREGRVWLRVSGRREGDTEILHFEVEDTGIGIREEDLPKLFAEYERIEESRNRHIEGTGLGMSIVLKLLALMDTRLEVKSDYGKGSLFSFDLTQRIMDDTPLGDFGERIRAQADHYTYAESFIAPGARILVTDDNSMNRKVFISLLKATQMVIDEASGGQEAIDLVKNIHYDIIFMDHMMPEMDGVEAMRRIRALPDSPCRDTPIYVLTANAVSGAREAYLAEGFDGFLSKPIVSGKLEEIIRSNLPAELVTPVEGTPPERSGIGQSSDTGVEDLPVVDGLDWYYAAMHLPEMNVLAESVREFVTLIPTQAGKLAKAYEQIPAAEGFEAYRIQVHGMKSSAATVGIVPLAGMAKLLESAAKDCDEEAVHRMHELFLREWNAYTDKLDGVFGIGEDAGAKKPAADMAQVGAMIDEIIAAMEDFDVDTADSLVGELSEYAYDEMVQPLIQEIRAAVTDLDEDRVRELKEKLERKDE